MATLCKLVVGCVHPPRHQGPCEVTPPGRLRVDHAVSFLDDQKEIAKLAGRISEELMSASVTSAGGWCRPAYRSAAPAPSSWASQARRANATCRPSPATRAGCSDG